MPEKDLAPGDPTDNSGHRLSRLDNWRLCSVAGLGQQVDSRHQCEVPELDDVYHAIPKIANLHQLRDFGYCLELRPPGLATWWS